MLLIVPLNNDSFTIKYIQFRIPQNKSEINTKKLWEKIFKLHIGNQMIVGKRDIN